MQWAIRLSTCEPRKKLDSPRSDSPITTRCRNISMSGACRSRICLATSKWWKTRDQPGFSVRLGLECDFIEGHESWIETLAGKAPWDYLIGSVHYIAPGWDVDNPKYLSRFREHPVDDIWALYWKHYVRCIESGLFDFVGHPDLAKKFGHRPQGDLRRYYQPAVESLAKQDVAFEINTAGLRKEAEEIYPALQFIELAREAGVATLINSDAHAPGEVGYKFDQARDLARQAGYSKLCRFEKRRRIEVDL